MVRENLSMAISKNRMVSLPVGNCSARKLSENAAIRLKTGSFISACCLGLGVLCVEAIRILPQHHVYNEDDASPLEEVQLAGAEVSTCFTPAQLCSNIIVEALNHAQTEIRVRAYGFTSILYPDSAGLSKETRRRRRRDTRQSDERTSISGSPASGSEVVAEVGLLCLLISGRPLPIIKSSLLTGLSW